MLQGVLRPSHSSGSWQRFASHSWLSYSLTIAVLFHTRQGFASLAAWISCSPSVRRSLSPQRGTSQVRYVTMVPRGNEMLRHRAIIPAFLLELCFIPWSESRLQPTCFYASWSVRHPAHDVLPIICTDYTYDADHDIAEGVPPAFNAASHPLWEPWFHT